MAIEKPEMMEMEIEMDVEEEQKEDVKTAEQENSLVLMPTPDGTMSVKQEPVELTPEMLRRNFAKGATPEEFFVYAGTCRALRLNPVLGEAHFVKYGNEPGRTVTSFLVYVRRAEETGLLKHWEYQFSDLLNEAGAPISCTITIERSDRDKPFVWEVDFAEVVGEKKDGTVNKFWRKMPRTMLRKCAIAQAFRACFASLTQMPYIDEEIREEPPVLRTEVPQPVVAEVEELPEHQDLSNIQAVYLKMAERQFHANTNDRIGWETSLIGKPIEQWNADNFTTAMDAILAMPNGKQKEVEVPEGLEEKIVEQAQKNLEAKLDELEKEPESDQEKLEQKVDEYILMKGVQQEPEPEPSLMIGGKVFKPDTPLTAALLKQMSKSELEDLYSMRAKGMFDSLEQMVEWQKTVTGSGSRGDWTVDQYSKAIRAQGKQPATKSETESGKATDKQRAAIRDIVQQMPQYHKTIGDSAFRLRTKQIIGREARLYEMTEDEAGDVLMQLQDELQDMQNAKQEGE